MTFQPHKTIRIAVSGDVALDRLETRVIDTADFQRLRGIRQLGAALWVYPTALHTRFDHTLGTLHVTQRMLDALAQNAASEISPTPEQIRLARMFALLHDICHVPFGHTLEDEFSIFERHDRSADRFERFLGARSEIGRVLCDEAGAEFHGDLVALFALESGMAVGSAGPDSEATRFASDNQFIADLVSNTICADLLDYLERDAFFCNVRLETDTRFLRYIALARHEGRTRMVIPLWKEAANAPRRDVLNELIRLLDNRYLLGERVYFHHAKLIAGAMIAGAVHRAHAAGALRENDLFESGDEVLLYRLQSSNQCEAAELARMLTQRRLYKACFEKNDIPRPLALRLHRSAKDRTALEDSVAAQAGLRKGQFLLHLPHPDMQMKIAESMVVWNGRIRPLKDCAEDPLAGAKLQSILDSHQNLWAVRGFVHPDRAADSALVSELCLNALLELDTSR